jgi:hypothetical protein
LSANQGAYLNLDGGFDSAHNRKCIFHAGLIPNIKENSRNRKALKRGRTRLFNEAITTWKVSCNLLNLRKQFTEGFFSAVFVSP